MPVEGFAVYELEDEERRIAGLVQGVDGRDVRVIERRQELRFTAQSGKRFGGSEDAAGKNLECDVASELRIPGGMLVAVGTSSLIVWTNPNLGKCP